MPQKLNASRASHTKLAAGEKTVEYNGMKLAEAECHALEDIERAIKRPVPGYGTLSEYEAVFRIQWREGQEPCPWLGFVAAGGHVTYLTLKCQELPALPESIGNLQNLEVLNVVYNRLDALPKSIGTLGALRELFFDHNQIAALPNNIGALRSLRSLSISENNLTELPDSFGALESVELIFVRKNQLDRLPTSIGQLPQLRKLSLDYNRLETLPDEIGDLRELRSLAVDYNPLTALPDTLGQLTHLKDLYCEMTRITRVPDSIGDLQALEELDLSNNPSLHELPEAITRLHNLKRLALGGTVLLDWWSYHRAWFADLKRRGCDISWG